MQNHGRVVQNRGFEPLQKTRFLSNFFIHFGINFGCFLSILGSWCAFLTKKSAKNRSRTFDRKIAPKRSPRGIPNPGSAAVGHPPREDFIPPFGLIRSPCFAWRPGLEGIGAEASNIEARGRIYVASGEFRPRELKDFVKQWNNSLYPWIEEVNGNPW